MSPQPLRQVCRARLVLDKARALPRALLLIPLLLCLGTPPARAGSWTFTCTGSGSLTYVPFGPTPCRPIYWTPPGPQSGRFDLGSTFGGDAYSDYYGSTSAKATITLQVAATWSPAAGQTAATDPPPPSVWLCESGRTEWSIETYLNPSAGKCSDGLGAEDAETNTSGIADSSKAAVTSPPAYWTNASVVNGVATLPQRTLSAAVNIVPAGHGNYFSVHIDNYSVTVHPQPYNMRLTPYVDGGGNEPAVQTDNVTGRLRFHYSISSTDGAVADLTSITAYETLNWSGNPAPPGAYPPGLYAPPSPPVQMYSTPTTQAFAYKNPDTAVMPYLTQGYVIDQFSPPETGFVAPYPAPSTAWTVTQNYLFDDKATGEIGTKIPGPDNNSPFTITRTVTPSNAAGTLGVYTVTTRGHTAQKILP